MVLTTPAPQRRLPHRLPRPLPHRFRRLLRLPFRPLPLDPVLLLRAATRVTPTFTMTTGIDLSARSRPCPALPCPAHPALPCLSCPALPWHSSHPLTRCLQICLAGTYVSDDACTSCELGRYQPNNRSTTCLDAPLSAYVDTRGATEYQSCPKNVRTSVTRPPSCWRLIGKLYSLCFTAPSLSPAGSVHRLYRHQRPIGLHRLLCRL